MDEKEGELIEELRVFEQHLQNLLAQKQMIQIEMQEILNAMSEISKTKDNVYKILGGIMIKADKTELTKELEERKKFAKIRLDAIEKQERNVEERINKVNKEIRKK